MGQILSLVLGLVMVLGFALFSANLYSVAVTQGGHMDSPDFPLADQISNLENKTTTFRDDLTKSVQESQEADPSTTFGDEWQTAGSAIVKSLTFSFEAVGIMLNMANAAFWSVQAYFAIPDWVLAISITALSLIFVYALAGTIMRSDV